MFDPSSELVRAAFGPEEKRNNRQRPRQRHGEQFRRLAPCHDPLAAETCAQVGEGAVAMPPRQPRLAADGLGLVIEDEKCKPLCRRGVGVRESARREDT